MTTQPQLLQIPLDPGDVVYTPDWVAKDMVEFFKPSGRILEPCAGDGVFLKYLPPETEWCEIEKGRDFFAYNKQVDWIMTNPPFKNIDNFLEHSYSLANDIVFLIPPQIFFRAGERIKKCFEWGKVKHLRIMGNGGSLGFPMGNPIAAFHFQRGYTGPMYSSIYGEAPTRLL